MSVPFGVAAGRPFNHYVCPECRGITITKHEDDGVTPFMLRCRATKDCAGMALSDFYRGPQHSDQQPHVIWFRPADVFAAIEAINAYPSEHREALLRHWQMGGCLLREVPA